MYSNDLLHPIVYKSKRLFLSTTTEKSLVFSSLPACLKEHSGRLSNLLKASDSINQPFDMVVFIQKRRCVEFSMLYKTSIKLVAQLLSRVVPSKVLISAKPMLIWAEYPT